ncbi:PIG-L deacetylase family protein [Thermanaerothrix sp.]|jgi:LmbE family N-acetylglucosaminyl deacetylase|uniref:PIG-L deacetylase family protein n=1 Tax=Thermanaerothrix sp. TaxID=2972675 RepID=UPI002ADDB3BA|nr:PIG-L deacetylase family protein [Thermanaerothrix sp.]
MGQDMYFYGRRVCFIGAHPDDIELGCGALIAHIVNQTEILCVTLSDNQKNPELKNLVEEHYRSMAVLGVPEDRVILGQFETRRFPHARQEILEYLIQINRTFQPDLVFVHTKADIHQDHATVTEEALRAFRGTTVLGFDVIRSSYGFFPSFLVEVTEEDVEKKIAALAEYKTYQNRYYFDPKITRATLIRNGAICERPYAEGFDILRIVGAFRCSSA